MSAEREVEGKAAPLRLWSVLLARGVRIRLLNDGRLRLRAATEDELDAALASLAEEIDR